MILLSLATAAEFGLGSYGRVQVSTEAQGGQGEPADVVLYPSRLQKDPYVEVDLWWRAEAEDGAAFKAVFTPALAGELFHYDGSFDADLAVRNLYVEATGLGAAQLSAWAGSRMYRGEDVYLLDFWPLDEINTVGGGFRAAPGRWQFLVHGGLSRPVADEYQLQYLDVPEAGGVGTDEVLALDRQRAIASLGVVHDLPLGEATLRLKAWGEGHQLPPGEREVDGIVEALPRDGGALAGVMVGASGWRPGSHVNLWGRLATGLATCGELGVPEDGLALDGTVADAREGLFAVSAAEQVGRVGLLVGAYARRYDDADGQSDDVDDRWEMNVALRPAIHVGEHVQLAMEVSHQWLRPDGLNPQTDTYAAPQVTKIAVLPALQLAPSILSRPQLRLQYVYSHLSDDARLWFPAGDARRDNTHQHFVGLGAEWWIDSASYR